MYKAYTFVYVSLALNLDECLLLGSRTENQAMDLPDRGGPHGAAPADSLTPPSSDTAQLPTNSQEPQGLPLSIWGNWGPCFSGNVFPTQGICEHTCPQGVSGQILMSETGQSQAVGSL